VWFFQPPVESANNNYGTESMMKMKFRVMMLLFLITLTWGCSESYTSNDNSSQGALEPNSLTPEEAASGWILLFDGKSLDGWEDPSQENPPGNAWIVQDGCIKATSLPRLREDLFTRETFNDFELKFEWKISEGGNSGVKYRIQDRAVLTEGKTNPDAARFEDKVDYELLHRVSDRKSLTPKDKIEEYVVAFEYQIIDNQGHPDAANDTNRQTGAIYGLVEPSTQSSLPVGQFNQSRIVLRGNQVEHWLNGNKIVNVDLKSEPIRLGLENRWSKNSPVYQLLTEMPKIETPVALQHHNDEVWFRAIKIRRLD
jgi:hypothetical protein